VEARAVFDGIKDKHQEPEKGFDALLHDVSLPDLIQFICLERKPRELKVRSGLKDGGLFFDNGEIVHAYAESMVGVDAFYEILSWSGGSLTLQHGSTDQKTIDLPWSFLVMEAAKRIDEGGLSEPQTAEPQPESELDTCKVLIVDDSELFRRELQNILTDIGNIEVMATASNGKAALEILETEKPDLITLDANMPVMGGDLALKHIMVKSPAPVLLVSGLSAHSFGNLMDFIRLGAIDFLPKPENPEDKELFVERLRSCTRLFSQFYVDRLRRSRAPKPPVLKARPGLPAEKLLIMNGGWGGLLETLKIVPSLTKAPSFSAIIMLDIYPRLLEPVAKYLDAYSMHTVAPLLAGGPLLESQLWISCSGEPLEVIGDADGRAVRVSRGAQRQNLTEVLSSALNVYGEQLYLLFVSGSEPIDDTIAQKIVTAGATVLIQDPATALYPAPLEELERLFGDHAEVVSCEEVCTFCERIFRE